MALGEKRRLAALLPKFGDCRDLRHRIRRRERGGKVFQRSAIQVIIPQLQARLRDRAS